MIRSQLHEAQKDEVHVIKICTNPQACIQLSMGLSKSPRLKSLLILSIVSTASSEGIYVRNSESFAQSRPQQLSMSILSRASTLATYIN